MAGDLEAKTPKTHESPAFFTRGERSQVTVSGALAEEDRIRLRGKYEMEEGTSVLQDGMVGGREPFVSLH